MNIIYPKVTIGVRCYNASQYIERCACSLFKQTYENCDFLFVDDCSTDDTIEIIESTIKRYPKREKQLRIIRREKNGNRAECLNTLLDNIEGDFFTLLDSDDYLDESAVELLINKQTESNYDIVVFEMLNIFKNKIVKSYFKDYIKGEDLCLAQLAGQVRWCICGELIRSSLITNDIRCISGANMGEDFIVSTRIAFKASNITTLHRHLYFYDRTNENASTFRFNIEYRKQFDTNLDLLYDFFKDKGDLYINAWYKTRLTSLIEDIKGILKEGGNSSYYNNRAVQLRTIDKKYKGFYNRNYKLIENLIDYRWFLSILLRMKK